MSRMIDELFEDEARREAYAWKRVEYEPDACKNCGRMRVNECVNGKKICEKCHWDQEAGTYDGIHMEVHP